MAVHYTFCTPILLILLSCGRSQPETLSEKTNHQLDALFADWNENTPGGVLTVAKQGKIIYNKAFGMADLEHDVPNTTNTIFETGSVAKQFTAAAIYLLETKGQLSLDDEVRKYLPELPDYTQLSPDYKQPMTINHLLHHTSGLRDWGAIALMSGWERGTRVYTQAHVLDIVTRQKGLNFPPGEQYGYSNSNYNLLAMIVERVSGKTFNEFTRVQLFQPLRMYHTQWRNNFQSILKNRAIAYSRSGKNYYTNMPFENAYGNGGLLTTTEDLLKWNAHYTNLWVGGEKLVRQQLQRGKLNNNLEIAYAGGVFLRPYIGVSEISHGGFTAGYRAWLAYYPNQEVSVAYLSNDGSVNPETIGAKVAEIVLGKKLQTDIGRTIPLGKSMLQPKIGRYKSVDNDEMFELELKNEKLRLKSGQVLLATAPNVFHWGANRMEFSKDPKLVTVYTGNGDSVTYIRKEPFKPTLDELPTYIGNYYSAEAQTTLLIEVYQKGLRAFVRPTHYYFLSPAYRDAFVNPSNYLFQFQRDSKGNVCSFTFSTPRAQGVRFEKLPTGK